MLILDKEDFESSDKTGKRYYICSHCNLDCITQHDKWCPICGTEIEWITRPGETAHANINS